jgi:putative Mg2+ transporter-C (MgtC) family protein
MPDYELLLKILLAATLGGIIGLEREWSQKGAGLRTNILIAIGSTLITLMSQSIAELGKIGDPGRLTAQIVTGIGFIGTGAIIQARFAVHGLTTAATIWTTAAIGITVGLGFHSLALAVTVLVVLVLSLFQLVSRSMEKSRKGFAYSIATSEHAGVLGDIKKIIHELAIHYEGARIHKQKDGYHIDVLLQTSEEKNREFLNRVMQLQQVIEISNESL